MRCGVFGMVLWIVSSHAVAQEASAFDRYRIYRERLFQDHFREGSLASRRYCKPLELKLCPDRHDAFYFPDSTYYTGWLLAFLAKEYSLGLAPAGDLKIQIHEILNGWERLSSYSDEATLRKVQDLHKKKFDHVMDEFAARLTLLSEAQPSGYVIREDLGDEFDLFMRDFKKPALVDPSVDQYTGIVFGLVVAKKLVPDPDIQDRLAVIARRIRDYFEKTNWVLKRPWDQKLVARGPYLTVFRYTFTTAFEYLTGETMNTPRADHLLNRFLWFSSAYALSANVQKRCGLLEGTTKFQCHYFNDVMFYQHAAFAALEAETVLLAKNRQLIQSIYLDAYLANDRSPILALVAKEFFGVSGEPVDSSFAVLESAPENLPNNWNNPWFDMTSPGPAYNKSLRVESDVPKVGVEKSGIDFLLPFVFSKYALIPEGGIQ
jgi:hypothetical protein